MDDPWPDRLPGEKGLLQQECKGLLQQECKALLYTVVREQRHRQASNAGDRLDVTMDV